MCLWLLERLDLNLAARKEKKRKNTSTFIMDDVTCQSPVSEVSLNNQKRVLSPEVFTAVAHYLLLTRDMFTLQQIRQVMLLIPWTGKVVMSHKMC